MKLNKTVKRIAALGVGLGMMGATLLGAMATADLANYPSMFINAEGQFDGVFVVGKNAKAEDIIGQSLLTSSIQAVALKKTPIEGASTSTSVSEGYEMGNNDWYFNKTANEIDDQLTDAELPNLLSTGTFVDNEGENKQTVDYKQKIFFPNRDTITLLFAQDDDTAPNAGVYLYFKDNSAAASYTYNYTLSFDTRVNVDNLSSSSMSGDLEGTTITIMGKDFTIVDLKYSSNDLTELKFLGGENVMWMSQGEKVSTSIDGTDHSVEMVDVTEVSSTGSVSSCGFLVDGSSVWVDVGATETINGVVIGVTDGKAIHSELQDTDVCKVSIGAHTVNIRNGAEIKIGDDKISDATTFYASGHIDYPTSGANAATLGEFAYQVNPDADKLYLAEGDELVDPVFGTFKIVFADLVEDTKETFAVDTSSKTGTLKFQNKDDRTVELDFKTPGVTGGSDTVYWSTSSAPFTDIEDNMYMTGNNCTGSGAVTDCKGAKFLVSAGSNQEAHVVKINNIDINDDKISFEDLTYGTETNDLAYTDGTKTSFSLSGISEAVQLIVDETNKMVYFTYLGQGYLSAQSEAALAHGNYSAVKMKTKNSGYVYIARAGDCAYNASTYCNSSTAFGNESLSVGNFTFVEYSDTGSVADFFTVNANDGIGSAVGQMVTPVYDATSDNALELSHNGVVANSTVYTFGKKDLSDTDDDNKMTVSLKGTMFTIDDDSSKQSFVIEHPKVASYARIYVAPVSAATAVSAAGTYTTEVQLIGVDQFKLDSEVADPSAVNVIAVGGPCANSVVSALMNNPAECYSAMGIEAGQGLIKLFEDATTGKMALVVAGQTAADTRLASQMVASSGDYALSGSEVVAITVNAAQLSWKTKAELAAAVPAVVEPVVADESVADEPVVDETATE